MLGVSAFVVVSIIAVTSIPSVSDTLNWSEWRCVHSKLGTVFLFLSVCHVIVMGAPGWAKGGWSVTVQSITFLSIILPVLVLLSKAAFGFTPLRWHLSKIRKGWERDDKGNHIHGTGSSLASSILSSCCCCCVKTSAWGKEKSPLKVNSAFLSSNSIVSGCGVSRKSRQSKQTIVEIEEEGEDADLNFGDVCGEQVELVAHHTAHGYPVGPSTITSGRCRCSEAKSSRGSHSDSSLSRKQSPACCSHGKSLNANISSLNGQCQCSSV